MEDLDFSIQSFDIARLVSVYPDRSELQWFTKAWFNNNEAGEPSVEIEIQDAVNFIHDRIDKDEWLEKYFPEQMQIYHQAIEQTREQLLNQHNL